MATEYAPGGVIRTTLGAVDDSTPGTWTERTAGVDYHPGTGMMTRKWVRERTWRDGVPAAGGGGFAAVGRALRWFVKWVWTTILYLLLLLGFALVCAIGGMIAHAVGAEPLAGIVVAATIIAAVVAVEDAGK